MKVCIDKFNQPFFVVNLIELKYFSTVYKE